MTNIARSGLDERYTVIPTTKLQFSPQWSQLDDADLPTAAHEPTASASKTISVISGSTTRSHVLYAAAMMIVVSMILIPGYAALLSWAGMPTSILQISAILLSSTLSSIAGFAFSAIGGSMLLRLMTDPIQIVEALMVCSVAIQAFSVVALWRDIRWRDLSAFLAGGIIGLPIGVFLLLHLRQIEFKEAIGALLTAYAIYALLKRPLTIQAGGRFADACAGFLGGITGGLAGFPGASVTIWCGMRGWDRGRQRGTYQPFILIMQIMALTLIGFTHASHGSGGALDVGPLRFVPAALLGTWFGLTIFRYLSDRLFALTVNLLLLASGIALVV